MRRAERPRRVPAVLVALLCACSGSATSPSARLEPGTWGGDHVVLTVGASASHLEFDCAHGDVPGAFGLDAQKRFELTGTYVREHGGPIHEGEAADQHPAVYRGSVSDDRMSLSVQLTDSGTDVGTFALSRGSAGHVVKCL